MGYPCDTASPSVIQKRLASGTWGERLAASLYDLVLHPDGLAGPDLGSRPSFDDYDPFVVEVKTGKHKVGTHRDQLSYGFWHPEIIRTVLSPHARERDIGQAVRQVKRNLPQKGYLLAISRVDRLRDSQITGDFGSLKYASGDHFLVPLWTLPAYHAASLTTQLGESVPYDEQIADYANGVIGDLLGERRYPEDNRNWRSLPFSTIAAIATKKLDKEFRNESQQRTFERLVGELVSNTPYPRCQYREIKGPRGIKIHALYRPMDARLINHITRNVRKRVPIIEGVLDEIDAALEDLGGRKLTRKKGGRHDYNGGIPQERRDQLTSHGISAEFIDTLERLVWFKSQSDIDKEAALEERLAEIPF